jgi:pimeloyl-ACP methyl ester carboxylesterase
MQLSYEETGDGPAVVLLHGFPLDRTMWEHQRAALKNRFRAITPDLRGHGRSEAPAGPYTMDALADDVVEQLDTLKVSGPVVLGGLSMGGYVALAFAVRHPERLRGLMLFDTRANADTPEGAKGREEMARKVESAGSAEPVVLSMLAKLFSPTTRLHRPDLVVRVEAQMRRTPVTGVTGALRGMAIRPDRTEALARMNVPALVVVGADDEITPPAEARRIASALPQAKLVEVPRAGHMAPLENPEAVNQAVLAFLDGLP